MPFYSNYHNYQNKCQSTIFTENKQFTLWRVQWYQNPRATRHGRVLSWSQHYVLLCYTHSLYTSSWRLLQDLWGQRSYGRQSDCFSFDLWAFKGSRDATNTLFSPFWSCMTVWFIGQILLYCRNWDQQKRLDHMTCWAGMSLHVFIPLKNMRWKFKHKSNYFHSVYY